MYLYNNLLRNDDIIRIILGRYVRKTEEDGFVYVQTSSPGMFASIFVYSLMRVY